MKTAPIPDFSVQVNTPCSDPYVEWRDGDRKYHFWMNRDGSRNSDFLHSNLIEPRVDGPRRGRDGHRGLDATAKKWAPLIAAIMDKVASEDLVAKAYQRAESKDAAAAAARDAEIRAKRLARLARAAAALPAPIAEHLGNLPDDAKAEFVRALEAA